MKIQWSRYLVAAALILAVGVLWALADETTLKVEVRNEDGREITVDVNGVSEVIRLDDLAEGEVRSYEVGGHPITVKRNDDRLALVHEGGGGAMTWVDKEMGEGGQHFIVMKHGEGGPEGCERKVMFLGEGDGAAEDILILRGPDGSIDVGALEEKYGDRLQTIDIEGGGEGMTWTDEGGAGHPIIVKRLGPADDGMVRFRCEETGSMLTVKEAEGLLDSYTDPVTGCVMTKVEEPARKVVRVTVVEKDGDAGD
jgi:hypothetical protein